MNALGGSFRDAAQALKSLQIEAESDPLQFMEWLPPQHAFLSCPDRFKLLRAGNQHTGKTTALLTEGIYRCLGEHPYLDVPRAPVEGWLLCASWRQSIAIQSKLYAMAPKWALHPEQRFDPIRGFGSHHPALRFKNGSILKIRTTQQGGLDLAGATIDFALIDEPPWSERVYEEIDRRVMRSNGTIAIAMTPINRPVEWLRERCEQDLITDLHYRLEPQNLVPVGRTRPLCLADGTPMDEEWIAQQRRSVIGVAAGIILDGEWETRSEGRAFEAFDRTKHVRPIPSVGMTVVLGLDHGTRVGKEAAVLVGLVERAGKTTVYVLDEYTPQDLTTPRMDARGLLDMLKRNGLQWRDLSAVWGDQPTRSKGAIARKGNLDIEDHVARLLSLRGRQDLHPRIRRVKLDGYGAGSILAGCNYLHTAMVEERFYVAPHCTSLIESLEGWVYGENKSPLKDVLDSLRYALRDEVLKRRRGPGPRLIVR